MELVELFVGEDFAVTFVTDRETLRHHGNGILGLGLVFLGMTIMGGRWGPNCTIP